jgi:hypothetical protein
VRAALRVCASCVPDGGTHGLRSATLRLLVDGKQLALEILPDEVASTYSLTVDGAVRTRPWLWPRRGVRRAALTGAEQIVPDITLDAALDTKGEVPRVMRLGAGGHGRCTCVV